MQKDLTKVKIFQKLLGGGYFFSETRYTLKPYTLKIPKLALTRTSDPKRPAKLEIFTEEVNDWYSSKTRCVWSMFRPITQRYGLFAQNIATLLNHWRF